MVYEDRFFRLALLILFWVFMGVHAYYGRKARPPKQKRIRQERWAEQVKYESKWLVILRIVSVYAMIVFVLIWSLFPILIPPYSQLFNVVWIQGIAVIICITMIFGMMWVGIHLGRQVSGSLEIKEDHTLVTSVHTSTSGIPCI
ncbi:MAG: hypothetical protein ACFE9D_01875 [Promethearchaeota archaeon]